MGQPLCCSSANAGVWGERGYGDGSTALQADSLPSEPPEKPLTVKTFLNPYRSHSAFIESIDARLHDLKVPMFPKGLEMGAPRKRWWGHM